MAKITYKFFVENILTNPKYTRKQVYWAYQQTEKWVELREARLYLDNHRCRMCDATATCVHHRRYPDVLGEETVDDLTSLCHRCHGNFHHPPGLDEIRDGFHQDVLKGVKCPVCLRFTKKYKRKLNCGMASMLIAIFKKIESDPPEDGWLHVSKAFLGDQKNAVAQEYSKLKYWNLLEQKPNEDKSKNGSGYWRLTDLGRMFVLEKAAVKRHIFLMNNEFQGFYDEDISIRDALGDKFDYDELMKT